MVLLVPAVWAAAARTLQDDAAPKAKKTTKKKKARTAASKSQVAKPVATASTRKHTTSAKSASTRTASTTSRRRGRRGYPPLPPVDPTEGDSLNGEDLIVREAAVAALGPVSGTVVVTDPQTGRVLSIVNQKLALSSGEQPCSTVKLPVALAALSEGMINRSTPIRLSRRASMNLTEAIAHSNNKYFEELGRRIGFGKWHEYVSQFGFGELAGYQIAGEHVGTIPEQPAKFGGVARMSSFGFEVFFTPLQLAAFVSAVANGGTLYYLQYPRTPEDLESFQPRVKRQLNVHDLLPELREGMQAAVDYGTGRKAWQPFDTVYGKTGTCSHEGSFLGWFASYEGAPDGRLAVVVLLRSPRHTGGGSAAQVAGRVYRNLYERNYFGTSVAAAPAAAAQQ